MAPPNQRYRQIGFYLEGGEGSDVKFDLAIRPEDLTVTEPSRLVVQQTLGGAWVDSFDRGIVNISLSGTLGWRGSLLLSGEDAFLKLRKTVFLDWHQRRTDAVAEGSDPSEVKLTFIDTLDSLTYVVVPQQFTLRRSKSSPLLMHYQIRLIVVDDADAPNGILDQISAALSNPLRWLAGVTGLGDTLSTLVGYFNTGMNLYGQFSGAVRGFMSTAISVFQAVSDVASTARGIFTGGDGELLAAARSLAQAGSNAFAAIATDPTLPEYLLLPARRLSSLMNDADCTMANSFSLGRTFASYDDLMGASTCSSTGGGSPISTFTADRLNPFETYFPPIADTIQVTAAADLAMKALKTDPLLLLGQDALIASNLSKIAAGVTVS